MSLSTQLSKNRNGTWHGHRLTVLASQQVHGSPELPGTTERESKWIQARWYWGSVRTSQGNVLLFKAYNIVLKKTPTLNILYSWQFSAQTSHWFPYCTLNGVVNNVTAVMVNMSMSVTLNALKMTKKLSSKTKNQYIVPLNLLIIRSSLRTKSKVLPDVLG